METCFLLNLLEIFIINKLKIIIRYCMILLKKVAY